MIKAIIFDCFGVLVGRGFEETYGYAGGNSHKDHEFIEALLEQANRAQITQSEFRQRICAHLGISIEIYEQAVEKAEQPNYKLLEYIVPLRTKYKTAILSNVNTGVLERKIGQDWLNKCFDVWVISGEVGFIKPEPEIYEHTVAKLGVEASECVFIDDRILYVEAARAVGMKGILYKELPQMKAELEEVLADRTTANN
jgi:HAD superfamily hydrolase (TIGR01509 family)